MMQCLSGCQLLSPAVCTQHHVVAQSRPCGNNVTRASARGRTSGFVVRAESASSASTSATAEPTVEPPAAGSEVALSPAAPASKSIITEENIISAISGESKLSLLALRGLLTSLSGT